MSDDGRLVLGYPRAKVESNGTVHFSKDGVYRWALSRVWDVNKPMVNFIGLNPSTADATVLDPTLRKVARFSIRLGYGGFWMTNLFALRTPHPKVMLRADAPVGTMNDEWLKRCAASSAQVICCWGTDGTHHGRDVAVMRMLRSEGHDLYALRLTRDGHPWHPLYLRNDCRPTLIPPL